MIVTRPVYLQKTEGICEVIGIDRLVLVKDDVVHVHVCMSHQQEH